MNIGFYIIASVTVLSGICALTFRNLIHAILSLMVFFTGIAGIFVTLHADFIAVIQVLVYVGAVGVLILFAIMLVRQVAKEEKIMTKQWWVGLLVILFVAAILIAGIRDKFQEPALFKEEKLSSAAGLGKSLMTDYVLPFEAVSLLLTVALIGAVVIALQPIQKKEI